jgi:hypothetical protein
MGRMCHRLDRIAAQLDHLAAVIKHTRAEMRILCSLIAVLFLVILWRAWR